MADKEVKVMIGTETDMSPVEALEDRLAQIRKEKIRLQLDAKTEQIDQANKRIEYLKRTIAGLEAVPPHLGIKIDEGEVEALKSELGSLEYKTAQLTLDVEKAELEQAKSEVEDLDGKDVDIALNVAMENFTQGISQAKQGLSDLKTNIDEVAQAGMQSEQNKAFLEMNLGAEKAKQTYKDIANTVASMPGDDNTMRSVLSTAQALGNNLNADEMKAATATMADYMAGSAAQGKMAIESQQDIRKYLIDGNTAELERNSIVSEYVDKLKDAKTFQERQAAMQQVLNEIGYGGISQQDTMLNKQAEWEGMIYNSQDALSSMWLGAEKGAMDYILKLNESTNGWIGMGIVAAQMAAGPLVDVMSGISQIGMGVKTFKDAADFTGITGKLSTLKSTLISVGGAAKTAALNFLTLSKNALTGNLSTLKSALLSVGGAAKTASLNFITLSKNALISGYNVLKSAAMWVVQKVQLIASTAATYAMAAAQALLNIVMSMNPIMLVVIAITALIAVLVYLYYNVDSVRQVIDNLGASILRTAQWIYSGFMNIVNIVASSLSRAWNAVTQFGSNLVSGLVNSARNAVNGFVNWIKQIPTIVMNEFNRTLQLVRQFISSLPQRVWDMGVAIINALKSSLGIGSPGYMYYMLEGELKRLDNLPEDMSGSISGNIKSMGSSMVHSFEDTQFSTKSTPIGAVNQTFNINIDNVDSEDRIQQIVEVIRRELAWNNATAGRTV